MKNYSKYTINGYGNYNKGELVNTVITKYVKENPHITYCELEKVFPQDLTKRGLPLFINIKREEIGTRRPGQRSQEVHLREESYRTTGKHKEEIRLKDAIIRTTTEWNVNNIKNFIDHVHGIKGWVIKIKKV